MNTARPELNGSTVRISTGTTGLLIAGEISYLARWVSREKIAQKLETSASEGTPEREKSARKMAPKYF
jgi:hypothetical protein